MTDERKTVSIVGAGVVGTALACLIHRAGYRVAAIASRRPESVEQACRLLGRNVAVADPAQAARLGQIVLITTSDEAIGPVCRSLADQQAFGPGTIVAHCSGGLSSDVLAPAREQCGACVGSVHPMQTFPNVASALSHFAGTWCFCEGDAQAVDALAELFAAIGGRIERISTKGKVLYHAAAVVACNYLVVLLEAAGELATHAGLDRVQTAQAMHPLVRATVENVMQMGPTEALTGPVARGDAEVVERHIAAIEEVSPELAELYRLMGRRALSIARVKGTVDEASARRLRDLLKS